MKLVMYAGDEFLTGDDIAAALLELSEALAMDGTAETVEIPFVERDGTRQWASVLVGPASQIVAKTVAEPREEFEDAEAAARIRTRMQGLHATDSPASPEDELADWPTSG